MLLTLSAVVSCVSASLGLLFGLGAFGLARSSGLGLRALKWFGISALFAAFYCVAIVVTTLPDVALATRSLVARGAASSTCLLIACIYVYAAAQHDRPMRRWERVCLAVTLVMALAWLVPDLCRSSSVLVVRRVAWLGVTYTTTRPTALGQATYLCLTVMAIAIGSRYFIRWRRGERGALAHLIGISALLLTGINDGLAASGRIDAPYLLDVGQIIVVFSVGGHWISRFVANTRELERSGEQLRAAQAELVRRERLVALGELSAVVAHEVRNPLAVIFNALSSLRKQKPVSADSMTLLDIVQEEAERLKRVVDDLLDFARPHELALASVAPAQLLSSAVASAAAASGDYDENEIRNDVADDLPSLKCDERIVRQALVNLVTNALQARGRTEPVLVRAFTKGTAMCFSVHDNGETISAEVAEKMFTPFFTTRASGTGLGLAIVKRAAEAHGGEVLWQAGGAATEQGVTFTFVVPLVPAPSPRAHAGRVVQ